MDDQSFWQTKLHARLHDPAEKALVLLRDPEGHEGGTSRALHRDLGFQDLPVKDWLDPDNAEVLDAVLFEKGVPITIYRQVKRADWWAAGADRPQWPLEEITVETKDGKTRTLKVAEWAQVRWTGKPILIHSLSGRTIDLKSLSDTDITDIKQRSFDHLSNLVIKDGDAVKWQETLLAFWRFGPELAEEEDDGKLGLLWPLLPADTRVPDHSIWDHLDLTSAFAGAFAADPKGEAALLALSLGPVQPFIAAARSTSDLWAGSHLLSRLAWEAMKVVCERLGPDAILFPRLRGIPQVDVWLYNRLKAHSTIRQRFESMDWSKRRTDANPLFAAALPNRFVAVVPASQGREIVEAVVERVRDWLQALGATVVDRLLEMAELKEPDAPRDDSVHAYGQMREQLEAFPEVHWAVVPFSLIRARDTDRDTNLDTAQVSEAMAPFFGAERGAPCGFLDSPAWKVLQDVRFADNTTFFAPNPGVLYPAVYDLAERVLAAAKSVRPFAQTEQRGWRDSLTGESEWLTHDEEFLHVPPGERKSRDDKSFREDKDTETLWARIAARKPQWAKRGEHLGALSGIKRLWPTLFAEEVAEEALGSDKRAADRFVVSTHTMALARQLEAWLQSDSPLEEEVEGELETVRSVALPRRLSQRFGATERFAAAKRLVALLDDAAELEDEKEAARLRNLVRETLAPDDRQKFRFETYYALLLLDGDRMGRILTGDEKFAITYQESFHPQVRTDFDERAEHNPPIKCYGKQKRAISPNRHLAISAALNEFALHVVPEVVERVHLGRVIYAGGDDVLAMLPAADLLSAMQRLRYAYSGMAPEDERTDWKAVRGSDKLVCKDGFAYLRGRLMRMMGEGATASCGAVIAHHQAPLGAVLRELRAAEARAKNEGGRDAFSLTLIKRSGGAIQFTAKWGEPLELLVGFRDFLVEPGVSRRAVYNSLIWLKDLPADASEAMLGSLLDYQLARQIAQTGDKTVRDSYDVPGLVRRLAALACQEEKRTDWLQRFLSVTEFLARETRSPRADEVWDTAAAAQASPPERIRNRR